MALRSISNRYKSISHPSLGGGGSSRLSSYISSLTKKQNAAEDSVLDNQYADGIITPEAYLNNLKTRLSRDYLTPLQTVTLNEKMGGVVEKVNDSSVNRQYQAGEITTSQVYQYEREKLDKMTAIDSPAYQSLSAKVSGLKDKIEKETRTQYRLKENVRISKLPEDNSANLTAKARLYEKLQYQAALDGDTNQALSYEAAKNNYLSSASKSDIQDRLNEVANRISQTKPEGQGVPTSAEGEQLYNEAIGKTSTVTPGNVVTSNVPGVTIDNSAFPTPAMIENEKQIKESQNRISGIENKEKLFKGIIPTPTKADSPELQREYENLKTSKNSIDKLLSHSVNLRLRIVSFKEEILKAKDKGQVDFASQLTTTLNNLENSFTENENQIAISQNNYNDKVNDITESIQKITVRDVSFQAGMFDKEMANEKIKLETDFADGKLTKESYMKSRFTFEQTKKEAYDDFSKTFLNFGKEDVGLKYGTEALNSQFELDNKIKPIVENLNNYELFREGNKKITLKDFSNEKNTNVFDGSFIKVGNVFNKIRTEVETNPVTGDLFTALEMRNRLKRGDSTNPFYVDTKGEKKSLVLVEIPNVLFTTKNADGSIKEERKTMNVFRTKEQVDKQRNIFVPETKIDNKGLKTDSSVLYGIKEKVPKMKSPFLPFGKYTPMLTNPLTNFGDTIIGKGLKGVGDFFNKETSGVKDFMKKPEGKTTTPPFDFVNKTIGKYFPRGVQAAEISKKAPILQNKTSTPITDDVTQYIKKYFPKSEWANAIKVATGESSLRPNATNDNTNGSRDWGLFQINDVHAPAIKQTFGYEMEDLLDPAKNTQVAKWVYDRNKGWSPWVAAKNLGINSYTPSPTDLRPITPIPTITPTRVPTRTPTKQPIIPTKKPISSINQELQNQVRVADINKNKRIDWGESTTGKFVNTAIKNVGDFFTKPVSQPKINSPISYKQPPPQTGFQNFVNTTKKTVAPVIQQAQKFVAPVVQNVKKTASNVVKNVSSWISNLFKKK